MDIHEVTAERWTDLERLFESRGILRGCWCMIFRTGLDGKVPPASGAARKEAMRDLVFAGVPVGLIGYVEGEPVAWCSVAPRSTFKGLDAVGGPDDSIWSLTCFFVRRENRGQGAMRRLLEAAIDVARAHGAEALEAYPVDPDSPSYRFGGFVPFFTEAGSQEVGTLGSRRHVMRKSLKAAGKGG